MAAPRRRTLGALLSLVLAGLMVAAVGGTAQAADGYRYWNYFHLEQGAWAFSQVGPADYRPEDGAVEAYRYGTSTTAAGVPPRVDLEQVNFEAICARTQSGSGQKRVAVIIDYGTEADAARATPPEPRTACALVDSTADGMQVLTAVAAVRGKQGLVCALDGYPVRGCGTPVPDAPKPTEEEPVDFALPASTTNTSGGAGPDDEPGGTPLWPLIGAGAVVVLVAAGGVALSRRRSA